MANPLATLTSIVRPRPAPQLHSCPVCRFPVTPGPDAVRMRGDYYIHRACATYRVRAIAREFTRS